MPLEHRHLRVQLPLLAPAPPALPGLAPLSSARVTDLAQVLLDAYHGTVDDQGEDLAAATVEVERVIAGGSGPLLWSHSSIWIDAAGRLGAAVLTTHWKGHPLIAHVVTVPQVQGQGLGETLLRQAAGSLAAEGYRELRLWVTKGNGPAERLYHRIGFAEVPREAAP